MASREDFCRLLMPIERRHKLDREGKTCLKDLDEHVSTDVHFPTMSAYDMLQKPQIGGLYRGRLYFDVSCPVEAKSLNFNCKLSCNNWQECVAWLICTRRDLIRKNDFDVVHVRNWEFHSYAMSVTFAFRKKINLRIRGLAARFARDCGVIFILS